ncbi:MAG TPA: tetratricopeptide repeat protein [Streptosporangiaceae bacterium]|nr:tetratricopeptide repeat protein [Streptosporangiaceae bacterium]
MRDASRASHGDLPSPADLFVGRDGELAAVSRMLAHAQTRPAWGLGTTLSALGRLEEACPLLAEALQVYTDVNDPRGVAQCLEALAYVAGERANYESAARLMGAAAAPRTRVAARQPDTEQEPRLLDIGQ